MFECRSREAILSGPAGTGKTYACLWKLHSDLLKYPGSRGLMLRKTRVSLTEAALVTYEEQILGKSSIRQGPTRSHRQCYTYPNGSSLVVRGLDNPSRLFSTEYSEIYVQECNELTEDDWQSLARALRYFKMPTPLQIIGDCNPDHPEHWIRRRATEGKLTLFTGVHRDNPRYFDPVSGKPTEFGDQYLLTLNQLSGTMRARLLEGQWVASEGIVYEGYSEAIHLIDSFEIPESWKRVVGIDFGYTNPFVALFAAVGPDGEIYIYKQFYGSKRLVEDWGKDLLAQPEINLIADFICDHDAEGRATLERVLGRRTRAARKQITPGIEAVSSRLRIQPNGKPRLYIFKNSLVKRDEELFARRHPISLEQEILRFSFTKSSDGRIQKEKPAEGPDHGCDAVRYIVAHFDLGQNEARVY